MTKTQAKNKEINDCFSNLRGELAAIINEEFPAGAQVSWQHAYGKPRQEGEVIESVKYEWQSTVRVRNHKTGTMRDIEAKELELM
jgi:hypothetical protein